VLAKQLSWDYSRSWSSSFLNSNVYLKSLLKTSSVKKICFICYFVFSGLLTQRTRSTTFLRKSCKNIRESSTQRVVRATVSCLYVCLLVNLLRLTLVDILLRHYNRHLLALLHLTAINSFEKAWKKMSLYITAFCIYVIK
jgi:hypothetical protein